MRVALVDYGVGNLHSLARAIEAGGARVAVETSIAAALRADAIILPGVGAFSAAAGQLAGEREDLRDALVGGLPCLGICLGMQLLFEGSEEGPGTGIGLFGGTVRRLHAPRTPHMGWNDVEAVAGGDPVVGGIGSATMYYANSYAAEPADSGVVVATTSYAGDAFPAAVRRNRTWGVQFHPEKSGPAGLSVIENFLRAAAP